MASFSLSLHPDTPTIAKRDTLVLASNKDFFSSLTIDSPLCQLAQISQHELDNIKHGAFFKLNASTDSVISLEFSFLLNEKPGIRRFVIAVLPNGCSRHNTPAKSHAITSFIKSSKGSSSNLLLYLADSDVQHILARSVAIARSFSTFTKKSNNNSITHHFHLAIELLDTTTSTTAIATALNAEDSKKILQEIEDVITGIRLTQRLVDMPPNLLHTTSYYTEITTLIQTLNSPYVSEHLYVSGKELENQGFGGIYNVGKASEYPPFFCVLKYTPPGTESMKPISLVGKGIVYDTGGLSIKTPTAGMCGMKMDMGGSAAVLGAFQTIVKSSLSIPVYACVCVAENSIAGNAFRNDDIITQLSGKTVEVNNTDAEGRLVLADGVYYAAHILQSSLIIDIATLTGAQPLSTGKNHAGIYCNDDHLEEIAVQTGKHTGDLVFPLPYVPEFFKNEFRSQVADMKNSVADRMNAQSSCAGQFIGNHIEDYLNTGGKWLHVDIAGPAFIGERATGYGVALMYGIVKHYATHNTINASSTTV